MIGIKILIAILIATLCQFSFSNEISHLNSILNQLKQITTEDNFQQIYQAIEASSELKNNFEKLANSAAFTEFVIKDEKDIKYNNVGPFNGYTDQGKLYLASQFIKDLNKYPLFDVVHENDIRPNNTVFVLAHLSYHLKNPLKPANFQTPDSYVEKLLDTEAKAYIYSWNTMLNSAEKINKKTLNSVQIVQLLMNTRYRFAIPTKIMEQDGYLKDSPENIHTIIEILSKTSIADIQ